MTGARTPLAENDVLILGNSEYIIESVIGCGSSSIAYRAHYKDELNTDAYHSVLIKELFPLHSRGEIYRAENKRIICTPAAADFFEFHKERFKQGNKINLKLLEMFPDEISGNLNSVECNGTYYSVLTSHGGESLESKIESGKITTLREAAKLTLMSLHSLQCFHDNDMLHLDVSPDNILIIGERALLIDYNSTWDMAGENDRGFAYSEKEGYSAPEVTLKDDTDIGFSTDLYSICAMFYRMVTGQKLSDEKTSEKSLRESLSGNLLLFAGEFRTAVHKAVQIIVKGLHLLPRKRFVTAQELEAELLELINRIDGKGVSKSALWEISRMRMAKVTEKNGRYLDQKINSLGNTVSAKELIGNISKGNSFLLHGVGGIGKTRFLHEIWKSGTSRFNAESPVVYYVPLKMYQESSDGKQFIHNYIAKSLSFSDNLASIDEIIHELDRIFEQSSGGKINVLLLLDGLNEAGKNTEGLLKEIETLSKTEGVGILLTDRTDQVKNYGLERFGTATAEPLERSVVISALEESETEVPTDEKMLSLLSNPMMLVLYTGAYSMSREASEKQVNIRNGDELIEFYMDTLVVHQQRVYTGDEKLQMQNRYILRHLLLEIASAMKKKSSNILTMAELLTVVRRNYTALGMKSFGKAFPEYLGKSRLILDGIKSETEWFDFAVREVLCDETGLLVRYDSTGYSLIHDNFVETLALLAKPVDDYHRREKAKSLTKKTVCAVAMLALIGAGIFAVVKLSAKNTAQADNNIVINMETLSERQLAVLESLKGNLINNVGALNHTVTLQNQIIDDSTEEVLQGDGEATYKLHTRIEYAVNNKGGYLPNGLNPNLENEIREYFPDFPIDEYKALCEMSVFEHDKLPELSLRYDEMMCAENTVFTTYSSRQNRRDAYKEYLDACSDVAYYRMLYILMYLPNEIRTEIYENEKYTSIFDSKDGGLSVLPTNVEDAKQKIDIELEKMKNAENGLVQYGWGTSVRMNENK